MRIEKVAYLEKADHQYVHITTTDKSVPGYARFSDEERKVGELLIASHAGSFKPELWNFVVSDIETGVHKLSDLDIELFPNQ